MATISAQEFLRGNKKAQLVAPASLNVGVESQLQPGFLSRVGEDLKKRGSSIAQTFKDTVSGKINPLDTGIQTVGAVAGGVNDIIGEGIKSGVNALPQGVKDTARSIGVDILQTQVGQAGLSAIKQGLEKYNQWKEQNPVGAKNLESVLNIASLFPVGKGGQVAKEGTEQVVKAGVNVAENGAVLAKRATEKIVKRIGTPDPTPIQAAGQILQGETVDLAKGVRGLANLDTTNVKTFKDLNDKINDKISELAKKVDEDLGSDPTKKLLGNLNVYEKTVRGNIVRTNPVELALDQLDELYTRTGDAVKKAEIKELIGVAKKDGLNNQEINDIARVYGREFGEKAFSKTGDPLTSVNAQLYENTRSSLKELARSGISGKEAQLADQAMTNLYSTQRLIKQNVEAVNKLKQKISERGLLEKFGYIVSKYSNILTGGTIRGIVGGLLPRGAGYKVMNALDIEEVLGRNLKILQDAIKSGNNKDLEIILKKLNH